jgi:hypothetical protein
LSELVAEGAGFASSSGRSAAAVSELAAEEAGFASSSGRFAAAVSELVAEEAGFELFAVAVSGLGPAFALFGLARRAFPKKAGR